MSSRQNRQRLKTVAVIAGLLLLAVAVFLIIKSLLGQSGKPVRPSVAQIQLLKPPPPPPPPPPKPEEKPPEPEIKKEEVKLDNPKPEDKPEPPKDAPPPGEKLGLDAEGAAGGDDFGLSANKGGAGLIGGGGGNGSKFGYYVSQVQQQIQEFLARDKKLRSASYKVMVRVWLGQDGAVRRVEMSGSTGDQEVDQALKAALTEVPKLREAPPPDMPQPMGLRITSRA